MASRTIKSIKRKNIVEFAIMIIVTILLVALSQVESKLFFLSEKLAESEYFTTTVVYFGLINLNVVLILLLSFLLFRHAARLIFERKLKVVGSKLRTKLVVILLFFTLAPTVLFYYISARFITSSFDSWFSDKVTVIIEKTEEIGQRIYKEDQRKLEYIVAEIAHKINTNIFLKDKNNRLNLKGLNIDVVTELQKGKLDNISIYDNFGNLIFANGILFDTSVMKNHLSLNILSTKFISESIDRLSLDSTNKANYGVVSEVVLEEEKDMAKSIAPIVNFATRQLLGVVVVNHKFDTQILSQMNIIQKSFSNLKPSAQLVKVGYLILLTIMALLILFAAIWLGFYVASKITKPIQVLASATREVTLGNFDINLDLKAGDEVGALVNSFNTMTQDLQKYRFKVEKSQETLINFNEELEARRDYIEVVLKSISAGVIALSKDGYITSMNLAAEKLLNINSLNILGRKWQDSIPVSLQEDFIKPIIKKMDQENSESISMEVELFTSNESQILLVDAANIIDNANFEGLGLVIVFDDGNERIKAQKAVAWKEVAKRIAHEIKNPVTPIKLSAQRMQRRFAKKFSGEDADVFNSCVQTIVDQVDTLRDLVNEFSKFSRLPAVSLKRENLYEVLLDATEYYRTSYPDINFSLISAEGVPDFQLDKDQIKRVFTNIISNSVFAVRDGKNKNNAAININILYINDINIVRVIFKDNGNGISEEDKKKIFEPYFSTKKEGTGLGLAISSQIISEHGGYLRVSDNKPIGTKIIIEFPIDIKLKV